MVLLSLDDRSKDGVIWKLSSGELDICSKVPSVIVFFFFMKNKNVHL